MLLCTWCGEVSPATKCSFHLSQSNFGAVSQISYIDSYVSSLISKVEKREKEREGDVRLLAANTYTYHHTHRALRTSSLAGRIDEIDARASR